MWLRVAVVSVMLCAGAGTARAQDPDVEAARCLDFGSDDADVTARIADVRARIALHEPDMRHWASAWLTLFGGLIGVQLTLMFTATNDGALVDAVASTIGLALGLTTQLIFFPPLVGAGAQLDALPESTPEERLHKLEVAERLLRSSADGVASARGPIGPITSAVYSIAANVLVLVAFSRTVGAYLGAIGGLAVGQGRILTVPWGIQREWRAYRAAHADAGCAAHGEIPMARRAFDVLPSVTMGGAGLSFRLSF